MSILDPRRTAAQTPAPAEVVRVDPADGATGVFRDAPVVVCLSRPADPRSVSPRTLRVEDPEGPLPGALRVTPDGRVVVWHAHRLLAAGVVHFVVVRGVRDARGWDVVPHTSRFVPCPFTSEDLAG